MPMGRHHDTVELFWTKWWLEKSHTETILVQEPVVITDRLFRKRTVHKFLLWKYSMLHLMTVGVSKYVSLYTINITITFKNRK